MSAPPTLVYRLKEAIRDVPDFPRPGILFKDITPILLDPILCSDTSDALVASIVDERPDAIVGVESRGFFFGMLMAQRLGIPFIPVRKAGKLPYRTISHEYALEYGTATVEMHVDAVKAGQRVLIHDDLLATGGTAAAAAELVRSQGGTVAGFSFLVALDFLHGENALKQYTDNIASLLHY
jgi:adenine phosphoribosyltransferase